MGERKGQNKYYPPDYDPTVGGLNKFLGTHPLRERAKKIHLGILVIRFEMPYNIWCEGCKNHIGMGVRYNAEKSKVGKYYSTPVYQFKMKCHLCDNYIVMKTDPANLDYAIVSGAARQNRRFDPTENGQVVPDEKEVQHKLFDDPMYKLEHVAKDSKKSEDAKPRLFSLYERNHYVWDDDYTANSKLRAEFRTKKKELTVQAEKDTALLARSSLDIQLLPETEQDARLAAMMRLQTAKPITETDQERKLGIMNKPALPSATVTSFGGLRSEKLLKTKLSSSDLGIVSGSKRKGGAEESSDDAKRRSTAGDGSSLAEEIKIDEQKSTPATETTSTSIAAKSAFALLSNYRSDSSSEDNDQE